MRKIALIALTLLVVIMFTSCATIMSDDQTEVTFVSEPTGADVFVDGFKVGTTPLRTYLDNEKHNVEIKKDGFETFYARLRRAPKLGWQVVDIFVTGFIGNVIDLVTDNGWEVKPDKVQVTLVPKN